MSSASASAIVSEYVASELVNGVVSRLEMTVAPSYSDTSSLPVEPEVVRARTEILCAVRVRGVPAGAKLSRATDVCFGGNVQTNFCGLPYLRRERLRKAIAGMGYSSDQVTS